MTDKISPVLSPKGKAMLILRGVAIIRLISIIITFVFWFSLIVSILFLYVLKMIDLSYLEQFLKITQVLGIFGLSPFLLTVLSWRLVEKLCSFYIRKYIAKYLVN